MNKKISNNTKQYLSPSPLFSSEWKNNIFIIISYLFISIITTFPLIAYFRTHIPGPLEDNQLLLWDLWWVKYSIINLHQSPLYTDYLFYPEGLKLIYHSLSFYNTLLCGIPLQSIFSSVITYNILLLFALTLAGFGTYKLVYYITGSRRAAFVSGLIYAYCPYVMAHIGHHLDLSSIQWIPFYILFLLKLIITRKWRYSIYAGIVFGLASQCSMNYIFHLTLYTFLIL